MPTAAQGAARVAAINKSIAESPTASKGYVAASANPTPAALASGAYSNPHDAPTYNPANDPTTKVYDPNAPKPNIQPNILPPDANKENVSTAQPSPQTAQINPPNAATSATPAGSQYTAAQNQAIADATQKTQSLVDQVKQRMQQGLANAQASGTPAPDKAGNIAAQNYVPPPTQAQPTTTPNVDNFFNPQTNPALQQSTQDLMSFLSPPNVQSDLYAQMSKIQGEQNTLSQEQLQLMNIKNIMSGTADDIRSEIQAAGGFGTESQVQALATSRNKVLLKQATFLQDQVSIQQDMIKNDTTLMNFEKDMASTQFTQRMDIMNYQQKTNQDILNAARDTYKTLIDKNPQGLYNSLIADPAQAQRFQQITGLSPSSLQGAASTAQLDAQLKQAQIAKIYHDINGAGTDVSVPITTPNGTVNVPQTLAPYFKTAYDGTQYVDLSTLDKKDMASYAQDAVKAGVKPILDSGTAAKLNAMSVSKENLQNISDSLTNILNDTSKPYQQGVKNAISSFMGNADIKSFNAWRTAIINNVQALAGGQGSGLRINKAEIDSAMENDLPVITGIHADNLATAKAKIAKLNSQLDTWNKQILGGGNTAATHVPPVGTVINSGGKSYHVIDAKGNLEPI